MAEEPMEVSTKETLEDNSVAAAPEPQPQPGGGTESSAELPADNDESKDTPTKSDESGKKVYTEEERVKRKAYFKELREKKRLAREKNNRQNNTKRFLGSTRSRSLQPRPRSDVVISFDMTDEDDKVLEFYKVKLSALRSTNEQLHKRLAYLVKENMRLLQMGPPTKKV